MVYTEIQEKNGKKYYYRAKSIKEGKKVRKKKIYLGVNLAGVELKKMETEADKMLGVLSVVLNKEDVEFLKTIKRDFLREPKENFENRYEAFCSLFTYDSTGIEWNTLTFNETSYLLFLRK